ncbi:MAG: hypothetical protein HYU39_03255 [Thaumarchaeota archaeon]|nr:hypothetical protein [Nitrososphaerota archaeon]
MQRYSLDNAIEELNVLESVVAGKVRNYLEKTDIINAARGLIAVNKELYRVEEDARRLRLTGQLDLEIYNALTKGYKLIADRIMKTAYEYKYAHEVSVLFKALRFTNEVSSLSDYLREGDE